MNANADASRKLPFSLEAEQSVLGSVLIEPSCFDKIAGIITSDDFYINDHQEIYISMQELYLHNHQIDLVTLIDSLVSRGIFDDNTSHDYIRVIAEIVPSASNVMDYVRIVQEKSTLRKLITACSEITETAYSAQGSANDIVNMAEQKIFAIAQNNEKKGFVHVRELILQVYDRLHTMTTDMEAVAGTPTGFSGLDNILVGMGKGDLILIGARPGMGKTSFAMNIAVNVAKKSKRSVCVFSLEMSGEQLASRLLSSEAMIDSYVMRTGKLPDNEWAKLAHTAAEISECSILVDDSTGITVTGMKAKLRRVKNLGLVVIDYLQLMQSDKRIDNRVQEVAEISRSLKLLAKELQVPVITCAQLSRGPESRTDKKPMLSDLRDSGAIEQDADIVMFLYRSDYYEEGENKNTAEVIIAKNRHGSTGKIDMGWLGQYTKFTTLETDYQSS